MSSPPQWTIQLITSIASGDLGVSSLSATVHAPAFLVTTRSAQASILSHVYTLDGNPLVISVACPVSRDRVVISLRDVAAAEAWVPGALLVGASSGWACLSGRGVRGPFVLRIASVGVVSFPDGSAANLSSVAFRDTPARAVPAVVTLPAPARP